MDKFKDDAHGDVIVEKLIEGSKAWNGSPLPPYPEGTPVVSIFRYTFPPHTVTNTHFHEVINCGVVLQGVLTVVNQDGTSRDFHAGDAIIETDFEIHHGENRGDIPTILIMFYAGDGLTPLSIKAL